MPYNMSMRSAGLLFVLGAVSASAEGPKPVEELLAKMRRAYQSVRTASLQIKITAYVPGGVRTGLMNADYARPNKVRCMSDSGDTPLRRYSDGKRIVGFRGSMESETTTITPDTLRGSMPGNLEWLCFFDWKRQLSTKSETGRPGNTMQFSTFKIIRERWNGKEWVVLEESVKAQQVKIRYFIDPKTHLIWRCDQHNLATKKLTIRTEILKLKLNEKLDPAIFRPPVQQQ